MRLEEVHERITTEPGRTFLPRHAIVLILLSGALICSLATVFVAVPMRPAVAALVLLGAGLLLDRSYARGGKA